MTNNLNFSMLVDTDALMALYYSKDSNHARALEILKRVTKSQTHLFTTHWAISEVATLLSRRMSQEDASRFILETVKYSAIPIATIDSDVQDAAYNRFLSIKRKNTSMVDCINMALLSKFKLTEIFSFDEVYKKEGFKRIGIDIS